jgi:hypothetical protein
MEIGDSFGEEEAFIIRLITFLICKFMHIFFIWILTLIGKI